MTGFTLRSESSLECFVILLELGKHGGKGEETVLTFKVAQYLNITLQNTRQAAAPGTKVLVLCTCMVQTF